MRDCIVKITNPRRQKYWTYELEEYQAIKVYEFIQKLIDSRREQGSKASLAHLYDE
jgi:hypothetical protein